MNIKIDIYYRKYIVLIVLILLGMNILAQERLGFKVIGNITSEAGLASDVRITIFQEDRELQTIAVANSGKFALTFEFNHDYTLIISGTNCFQKKIAISTIVPRQVIASNPKFPLFSIEQSLFSEIKGIDKSFSDNSIMKIFYDSGIDNFISEVFYNDSQIKKQIENAIWRSQQVDKTADELSKISNEELRLMQQEYDQWIKEAGESYEKGLYQEALLNYKAANGLFPEEQFPIDRIAEINDLLLALQITTDLEKLQNDKFNALVKEADSKFELQDYGNARITYRKALNINISDSYVNGRINEIDGILADRQFNSNYDSIISEADRLFSSDELKLAKERYNYALSLKPKEEYPIDQIKSIEEEEERLEKQVLMQERYEKALIDGDNYKSKEQYLRAIETYNFALSFKPGDQVALDRITSVNLLIEQEEIDKDYEKIIDDADKSFNKKDYQEAITEYRNALSIKPDEEYPVNQINIIDNLLDEENKKLLVDKNYTTKIIEADESFKAANYDVAKEQYSEALKIKADEKYPVNKIIEIDKILADIESQNQLDERYNTLIASADNAFELKDYEASKSGYTSALKLKSKEQYPKDRITEIDNIIAQIKKNNNDYSDEIAKADKLYEIKSYDEAVESYTQAKKIKPDENYPDEMIGIIEIQLNEQKRLIAEEKARLAAAQEKLDSAFYEIVINADTLFNNKKYSEAEGKYRFALEYKPEELYPQQRIDEIKRITTGLAEIQKNYDDAITAGDRNFELENFSEAIIFYDSAKRIKPEELYPEEMIAKINEIENARAIALAETRAAEQLRLKAQQDSIDKLFNEKIIEADNNLDKKEYNSAVNVYRLAQAIKPNEEYLKQRIAETEAIIAELEKAKNDEIELNRNYDQAIIMADNAFDDAFYVNAINYYNQAIELKPNETYPSEKIGEINAILKKNKKDEDYNRILLAADAFFKMKQYNDSKNEYINALDIKPDEEYPAKQIDRIDEILRQMEIARLEAEKNALEANKIDESITENPVQDSQENIENMVLEMYNSYINDADLAFNSEEYNIARYYYYKALDFMPEELYPRERIEKIKELLNALLSNRIEREYQENIDKADNALGEGELAVARAYYNRAVSAKPQAKYPKLQLEQIKEKLAEILGQKNTVEYDSFIKQGDEAFETENYSIARYYYLRAIGLNPSEQYPKQQIQKIKENIERVNSGDQME